MKYLLSFLLFILIGTQCFPQNFNQFEWGDSKESIKNQKKAILITDTENFLEFKEKIFEKGVLLGYHFSNDQLIKKEYTFINSKDPYDEIWATFKKIDSAMRSEIKGTIREDKDLRSTIEADTKGQMRKLAKGSFDYKVSYQDSTNKAILKLYSYGMNPRTNLSIEPLNFTPRKVVAKNTIVEGNNKEPERQDEKIVIKRGFTKSYYYKGMRRTNKELVDISLAVPAAYTMMYNSRKNETIADVLGVVGGFMFGYSLGQAFALSAAEYEPTLGLIGLGVIGASVIFDISGDSKRYKAAKLYNSKIK